MKQQVILPKFNQLLEQMGENIKLARKRRKLTAVIVDEKADLWIAKSPSKNDTIDKGAWEFLEYQLALKSALK